MTIYTQSRETHLDSSDGIEGYCYVLLRIYEGPQLEHSLPAVAVAASGSTAAAATSEVAVAATEILRRAAARALLACGRRRCEWERRRRSYE